MSGTPVKKNGASDSTRSNVKKRSRSAEDEDGDGSSQRKRTAAPNSTANGKAVFMRDEDDMDANEDDELVRGSKRFGSGLKRSKSGSNISMQDRKQENERRKEKARTLAIETAALPVNTGE